MTNTRLSQHFTAAEFMRSSTAARLGIDNSKPPIEAVIAGVYVADRILEPCRTHFGAPFSPSSWFRCLDLNRAIGSKDTSQHIKGQAVDFEIPGVANFELARWIEAELEFDQLILEFYTPGDPSSGWVHCSYNHLKKNRRSVLTFTGSEFLTGLVA